MPYSSDDARQKVYQEKPVSSVFVPGTELQEVVQLQCHANSCLPSSFLLQECQINCVYCVQEMNGFQLVQTCSNKVCMTKLLTYFKNGFKVDCNIRSLCA